MLKLHEISLLDGPKDDKGRPTFGGRLLARKYVKPEKIGSLFVNPAWQVEHSRSLWEPLRYSPSAVEFICDGIGLERDANDPKALPYREALESLQCVLVTQRDRGMMLPEVEGEREGVFVLWASEIVKVHPYVEE